MTIIHPTVESKLFEEGNYRLFKEEEYICAVLRMYNGRLNGYVGIPKTHPLYGKEYGESIPAKQEMPFNGNYIGALISAFSEEKEEGTANIDCYFNVHGGITYSSSKLTYFEDGLLGDLWWFGFDTAHHEDLRPFQPDIDRKYPMSTEKYRDMEYVINQTKSLAQQLAEYAK